MQNAALERARLVSERDPGEVRAQVVRDRGVQERVARGAVLLRGATEERRKRRGQRSETSGHV